MITIYILNCSDGTQYTGITKDINTRLQQHKTGKVSYTRFRLPIEIACSFEVSGRKVAARIERHIKTVGAQTFIIKNCDLQLFVSFNGHSVINGHLSRSSLEFLTKRFAVLKLDTTFAASV